MCLLTILVKGGVERRVGHDLVRVLVGELDAEARRAQLRQRVRDERAVRLLPPGS